MRLFVLAATAAVGLAALGTVAALSRSLGGWRWEAYEPRAERPARIPAVEAPDEPILAAMTESDIDSVPAGLEPRPAPAPEPEPEVALGDVAPKRPAKKKAAPRPKPRLRPTLRGKPRLTLRAPSGFDGAAEGSATWSEPEAAEETSGYQAAEPVRPPAAPAAPAPQRTFRSLTPSRPAQAGSAPQTAPAPEYDEDAAE